MPFKPICMVTEYQGKPTLELRSHTQDDRPFSFGVFRAKVILALIPEIQAFVKANDTWRPGQRPAPAPAPSTPSDDIGFGDPAPTATPPAAPAAPADGPRASYTRPAPTYNR